MTREAEAAGPILASDQSSVISDWRDGRSEAAAAANL
jgi:hypothetical protein